MARYKIPHMTLRLVREKTLTYDIESVLTTSMAAEVLTKLIGRRDTEHMAVLMLSSRSAITGSTIVAIGSLHGMFIQNRDLFKAAILSNAASIIVSHNHPSGDPSPSKEDAAFTAKAQLAGEILGIPVVDHVIVTTDVSRHFSFRSHDLLLPSSTKPEPEPT